MKKKLLTLAFLITGLVVFGQTSPAVEKQIAPKAVDLLLKGLPSNKMEITITEAPNAIDVAVRGVKSTGVRGCNNCNVAGKIVYTNTVNNKPTTPGTARNNAGTESSPFAVGYQGVKVVWGKDPGGQTYETNIGADGSFGFSNIPAGNYVLKMHGYVIVKGIVVKKAPRV